MLTIIKDFERDCSESFLLCRQFLVSTNYLRTIEFNAKVYKVITAIFPVINKNCE